MNSEAGSADETRVDERSESEDSAGGYVHRPDGEPQVAGDDAAEDDFGARGWVLVGVVVVATLVIPGVIYLYPTLLGDRVPFLVAMLALPFVPAVLLGATAVWSMVER